MKKKHIIENIQYLIFLEKNKKFSENMLDGTFR